MKRGFDPAVYAIVDLAPGNPVHARLVADAIDGGVTMVQVRGKGIAPRSLYLAVRQLLPVCRDRRIPLLVNDRPDVAAAGGADGVHLGQSDVPVDTVRRLHPDWIVGVSTRTIEQLQQAELSGADYAAAGSLYPTATKTDATPLDHGVFRDLCSTARIPVVGIGGISTGNAAAVRDLGASGLAVISGLWSAIDIRARAAEYALVMKRIGPEA